MENKYIEDISDCYLITLTKMIYHHVPVRAKSKDEALAIAEAIIDELAEEEIDDKFYSDMDWEFQVDTFEKAGYRCSEDAFVNMESKDGI
jgi:DNA topoisomerase VI subunit A